MYSHTIGYTIFACVHNVLKLSKSRFWLNEVQVIIVDVALSSPSVDKNHPGPRYMYEPIGLYKFSTEGISGSEFM